MFAMELVVDLQDVKAKWDDMNRPFNSNVPSVLPAQLVKLRTDVFIQEVLNPFCTHISKFWPIENINLIKDEHCDLLLVYNSNPILKVTIDKQDH
jgi:hypothetical protein